MFLEPSILVKLEEDILTDSVIVGTIVSLQAAGEGSRGRRTQSASRSKYVQSDQNRSRTNCKSRRGADDLLARACLSFKSNQQ